MFQALKNEMSQYYAQMNFPEQNEQYQRIHTQITAEMQEFYAQNPDIPALLLKSLLHTKIAAHFEPVIFKNSPFFFEMGLRPSANWGNPDPPVTGSWVYQVKNQERFQHPENSFLAADIAAFEECNDGLGIYPWNLYFDMDHHCLGYTELFQKGISGFLSDIQTAQKTATQEKLPFLKAAEESCHALLTVAEKFSEKALALLEMTEHPKQKKFLSMIYQTAKKIPKLPPETFYEGLCMLWFMREATATLDAIGISVVGHFDKLLGNLYEQDIKNNRITEDEARELLALWMLPTDVKFHLETNGWPETSTCIQLGGCDADGTPVFNKITVLTVEVHEAYNLVNPKLNCRYSQNSPKEYLRLLSRSVLNKHNNFTMQCDDLIIPSLMHAGISEADARFYVNGGCQETMIEGMGHSAGAYVYINLARFLDLSLRPHHIPADHYSERVQSATPKVIRDVESFEEFYQKLLENIQNTLTKTQSWRVQLGSHQPDLHPCPLYSLTQKGCIESGKDYTAGGAKYNIATFCAYGLGTLTDSLYAIKTLVFDEQVLTLEEFNHILETDWENNELLRRRCINLPKYGHGNAEVDNIANRLIHDLNQIATAIPNERGGMDILSFFVYYHYKTSQKIVRATPDGRKNGDLLSQGISPSQLQSEKSISETAKSIQTADFSCVSGNAVLDIRLPLSAGITEDVLADAILSLGKLGCPTVQPNVLSVQDLIDAKKHPEAHKDLIVRISGLSAFFVSLAEDIQDEIIARNQYQA
ncbi:MAG: hypothetical protein E7397_07575 [Ruminococcaceae bacterium]|nr:hypothetical protein [Oscillospiraceae bacterium]